MKVVYYSETGNVESFAKEIDRNAIEIREGDEIIGEDYLLVIPTTGIGEVPDYVLDFLDTADNLDNCKAACVSGSMEWEDSFCGAADQLEEEFEINVILKFENEGTEQDIELAKKYIYDQE